MSDDPRNDPDNKRPRVDRYLPGILVAAAVICALGLIGRALSG